MAKVEYRFSQLLPRAAGTPGGNPPEPGWAEVIRRQSPDWVGTNNHGVIARVEDADRIRADYQAYGIVQSVMPMCVRKSQGEEWFRLPLEPLVSISGKNTIVRRQVAKSTMGGTVKECWTRDDYEVTVQGLVVASDEETYPEECVRKLIELFGCKHPVEVEQPLLRLFGIGSLAVESVSFPHTKGMNYQNYEIKAYSDSSAQLLIPL